MVHKLLAALAAVIMLAGGAAAQSYMIQPGDRLNVSVLEDASLNRTVLVRPDGRISLPLAGSIQAGGRTPEAVEQAIRRALSRDFVQPPSVTVSLEAQADPGRIDPDELVKVFVIGQVAQPGRYELQMPIDLLQALATAGGPSVFAATSRIQVRRRVNGAETVFLFNYDLIEDGVVPSESVLLRDGDVIVVPQRGLFE
jgi:polysaccharide export outer membrane protein